ncbi:MAG: hypothetical protein WCC00_02925 [Candidatus Aminicenantales bacterium]
MIQVVWPVNHWTSPKPVNTQERSALEAFLDDPVNAHDLGNRHEVDQEQLNDIEAFLNDPITNFDRIKQIENLCNLIDRYEQSLIKNQSLTTGVLTEFFNRHFGEVDEIRTKIVIHMILHCGSGVQGETLFEKAAMLFCAQPQMFVKALEKTEVWKLVIRDLFYLGDISKGLEKLGNSRFEMKIREYVKELERAGR